jgi:transposase-like protein
LVEEALIEMYLAGVSVRRVEDITEALWGTRVSPSTVSDPAGAEPSNPVLGVAR